MFILLSAGVLNAIYSVDHQGHEAARRRQEFVDRFVDGVVRVSARRYHRGDVGLAMALDLYFIRVGDSSPHHFLRLYACRDLLRLQRSRPGT